MSRNRPEVLTATSTVGNFLADAFVQVRKMPLMKENMNDMRRSVHSTHAGVCVILLILLAACSNTTSNETSTQDDSETATTSTTIDETSNEPVSDFLLLEDLVRLNDPSPSEKGVGFQEVFLDLLDGEPFTSNPARSDFRAYTLTITEVLMIPAEEESPPPAIRDVYYQLRSTGWVEETRSDTQALEVECGSIIVGQIIQDQSGWISFSQNSAPEGIEESRAMGPECVNESVELGLERLIRTEFRVVLETDGTVTLNTADDQAQFRVFAENNEFRAAAEAELFKTD